LKKRKRKKNYNHDTMATSTPTILFSEIFKHSQKKKEKKNVKRKTKNLLEYSPEYSWPKMECSKQNNYNQGQY